MGSYSDRQVFDIIRRNQPHVKFMDKDYRTVLPVRSTEPLVDNTPNNSPYLFPSKTKHNNYHHNYHKTDQTTRSSQQQLCNECADHAMDRKPEYIFLCTKCKLRIRTNTGSLPPDWQNCSVFMRRLNTLYLREKSFDISQKKQYHYPTEA